MVTRSFSRLDFWDMRQVVFLMAILAMSGLLACSSGTPSSDEKKDEAGTDQTTAPSQEAPVGELKVVDLTPGQGDAAQPGDTVLVNYTGWLYENGKRTTQFDSSVGGDPFPVTIGVTGVIRGWTQGLVGMKQGGKRQLIIPPDLAYGQRGYPPVIPSNATLDFEIELLKLTKK